jgi:outer membrane lipopolysaccharide assembly protein LptE/RlpB
MRRLFPAFWVLFLAGCGYSLGPTGGATAGSRSVQVIPFANRTQEPRISEYLAASMRRRFQQDGTFRLETGGAADIQLTGEIVRFHRVPLSYATNDPISPQEYLLQLTAKMTARETASGKPGVTRLIQGKTYIRAGADLASAERENMPVLTDDLARNAVAALVDGVW